MAVSSLNPDEVRAAAATHQELGPEYQSAVIESFIEKVGREIDARVDSRLAANGPPGFRLPARRGTGNTSRFWLAIVSMVMGIPLTAIAVAAGPGNGEMNGAARLIALVVIWTAITVINVTYSRNNAPPGR